MNLFEQVFYFFVKYIFGGRFNGEVYSSSLGTLFDSSANTVNGAMANIAVPFFNDFGSPTSVRYIPLGNYFSFIATIISMIVIVVLCCLLIKKIYNICAHIIG